MPYSAKDVTFDTEFLKLFVLGKYGTGKSVLASTFPTPGYVFDFDNRIKTYAGLEWDYDTYLLTASGWILFENNLAIVEKAVKEGKYKTVVVDSVTMMNDCAMERALQIDPKRSKEKGPLWNVHYMIVKNILAPRIKRILSMNCNIVFTGHWDIKTDPEDGTIVSIDPILVGDLSDKIPGLFDEVYAADSVRKDGEEKFFVRTTTWNHYRSRSTLSGKLQLLPTRIPNSYAAIKAHADRALKLRAIYEKDGLEALKVAKKQVKLELPDE